MNQGNAPDFSCLGTPCLDNTNREPPGKLIEQSALTHAKNGDIKCSGPAHEEADEADVLFFYGPYIFPSRLYVIVGKHFVFIQYFSSRQFAPAY